MGPSVHERNVTNHIDFLLYIFSPALIRKKKKHVYEVVDKENEKKKYIRNSFPASFFVLRQQKCILIKYKTATFQIAYTSSLGLAAKLFCCKQRI